MINRTLIRLKVVQMLYSYLLTRSDFRLMTPPEKDTIDSRSAYSLYLDMMLLILELSGYNVKNDRTNPLAGIPTNKILSSTKMAKSLSVDSDIRDAILKKSDTINVFDSTIPTLYSAITSSEAFKDYCKIKQPEISDDVRLWSIIVSSIFATEPSLQAAARSTGNFSRVGFERALSMVKETLDNYSDTKSTLLNARRALDASLSKAYELYHSIFLLMVELTNAQRQKLEAAKEKFVPTAEDLNPNTRFVDNSFIQAIENNSELAEYKKEHPIAWDQDYYLIRGLLDDITKSEIYRKYMEGPEPKFSDDCELWRDLLRFVILPSDALAEALESKSVYWNDDLDIMGTFVAKTIRQWSAAGNDSPGFLPMFKDDEDAVFGSKLFIDAINNRQLYRSYIDRFIDDSQWDPERLAFMDIVIMTVIIAELLNFPLIPIPVTLNEYIEIANRYSTPKSGQFINGVIYNVIKLLKEEGKLNK